MLSRTHGQAASPTKLGKEINVFKVRIHEQLSLLKKIPISAKFGGATGNFNAHIVAYEKYISNFNIPLCRIRLRNFLTVPLSSSCVPYVCSSPSPILPPSGF